MKQERKFGENRSKNSVSGFFLLYQNRTIISLRMCLVYHAHSQKRFYSRYLVYTTVSSYPKQYPFMTNIIVLSHNTAINRR